METHVGKWGSSCAIRIPRRIAGILHLRLGETLDLEVDEKKRLILTRPSPSYTLETLVSQMDKCKEPSLLLDDPAQGDEML